MDDGSAVGALKAGQDGANGPPTLGMGAAIPPLHVSGLVVLKADLLAALRLYVPQAVDIEPLGGERLLLLLAGAGEGIK